MTTASDAVISTVQNSVTTLGDLYNTVMSLKDYTQASITGYTNRSNVIGRVYVEQKIADEEILPGLIGVLTQMYCGLVMTALNMNSFVTNTRRVRDFTGLISTESYVVASEMVTDQFGVDRDKLYTNMLSHGMIQCGERAVYDGEYTLRSMKYYKLHATLESDEDDKNAKGGRATTVELDKLSQKLVSGRVQEVTLTNPNGNKITALLYIQLIPMIVHSDVVTGYLQLNFTSSFWRRLRQYHSGEIKFWKDFILSFDQIETHKKALKADKQNALERMLNRQTNMLAKYWRSLFGINKENHNSANTILICERTTFDSICSQEGMDFEKSSDRQNFFRKSFSMMVVVVDTMYNNVTMYYNGIDAVGNYSFDAINRNAVKGKDDINLKDVMTMFGHGSVPRF